MADRLRSPRSASAAPPSFICRSEQAQEPLRVVADLLAGVVARSGFAPGRRPMHAVRPYMIGGPHGGPAHSIVTVMDGNMPAPNRRLLRPRPACML